MTIEPIQIEELTFESVYVEFPRLKDDDKRQPLKQVLGRPKIKARVSGVIHPEHPQFSSLEEIKDKFKKNEDITIKVGDDTDVFKIDSYSYQKVGGEQGTEFTLYLREK